MIVLRNTLSNLVGSLPVSAGGALATPTPAYAHVSGSGNPDWVYSWTLTPEILLSTVLLAVLYANGMRSLRGKSASADAPLRHVSFFGGLIAVFVALQSPLDAMADRSFFMHQVQHLLLQTAGPMLIMLAMPQRCLMAGTPAVLMDRLLLPLFFNRAVRVLFRVLALPWIAALLLAGSLFLWHWPPYHDLAVLDDGVHYLMHFTLLSAGLLFYWCVFDPRPAPLGATYGTRWNVILFTMTAGMLLGAVIAFKETVLYTAYDHIGRLWGLAPLTDERIGGLIMWIPGSILCVPALLVVLRMWNSRESRVDHWRQRGVAPAVPATRTGNSRFALRLAAIALAAFGVTLGIGMAATGQLSVISRWLARTFLVI
jgi:putative membrane protein